LLYLASTLALPHAYIYWGELKIVPWLLGSLLIVPWLLGSLLSCLLSFTTNIATSDARMALQMLQTPAVWMEHSLVYLEEQHGSHQGYISGHLGLTLEEQQQIRENLMVSSGP